MSIFDNVKAGERYGFDSESVLNVRGSEYRTGIVTEIDDTTTNETFCFFRCDQDGTIYALPESRCQRLVGPFHQA